jgi:Restriction endonuclease BglII
LGIDLLKFQVSSYSALDKIDVGIYIATTGDFQRKAKQFGQNWEDSLTFEKIIKYLLQFKIAIQVPIYVVGVDL